MNDENVVNFNLKTSKLTEICLLKKYQTLLIYAYGISKHYKQLKSTETDDNLRIRLSKYYKAD